MKLALICLILQFSTIAGAGIYSDNLWDKKDIRVCFAGEEKEPRTESGFELKIKNWNRVQKNNLQLWVGQEFTSERTGIYFTGWKDCQNSPNADVILFYNSNSRIKRFFHGGLDGVAGELGPRYDGEVKGFPNARSIIAISKTGMNKGIVIHEFGHVAGLAHEHNHPDIPRDDKSCSHYQRFFSTRLEYRDFDPSSIMSYCSIQLKKLSAGDVSLLRNIYP